MRADKTPCVCSFLAKYYTPAETWAQSRRGWLAERKHEIVAAIFGMSEDEQIDLVASIRFSQRRLCPIPPTTIRPLDEQGLAAGRGCAP
jgi:hypothetical protein